MSSEEFERILIRDVANNRTHRRVDVRLRVAVFLDKETACLAWTTNLGEGGMLLDDYHGPQLQRGRLVGISMRGVVSDTQEGEDHYLMRVVRHAGQVLALRFDEE